MLVGPDYPGAMASSVVAGVDAEAALRAELRRVEAGIVEAERAAQEA